MDSEYGVDGDNAVLSLLEPTTASGKTSANVHRTAHPIEHRDRVDLVLSGWYSVMYGL